MAPAIRIENLGKRYSIGSADRASYQTLRECLSSWAAQTWRCLRQGAHRTTAADFWALRELNLEIGHGEVVGLVGRNGAGKSTLLKILSRITKPTTGRVTLRGRVGSLLEVGTGFHQELTGRENIFLNGAILGMGRREITRKFDEITAFAEMDRFLDTPVKRYSSGMYVRLAFAVAAHLEPEILVVDEVLAVGDQRFQKKCLGKMNEVSRHGRTVLFVSHNIAALVNLCSRAVLIEQGRIVADGEPRAVTAQYLSAEAETCHGELDLSDRPRRGKGPALIQRLRMFDGNGLLASRVPCGEPLTVEFDLDLVRPLNEPVLGVGFDNQWGQRICTVTTFLSRCDLPALADRCRVRCLIPELPLVPGAYTLTLNVGTSQEPLIDHLENVVSLEVLPADFFGTGRMVTSAWGNTLVRSDWAACGLAEDAKPQAAILEEPLCAYPS
jgi:lipopolysaccharide transport system ATP-binding protein